MLQEDTDKKKPKGKDKKDKEKKKSKAWGKQQNHVQTLVLADICSM